MSVATGSEEDIYISAMGMMMCFLELYLSSSWKLEEGERNKRTKSLQTLCYVCLPGGIDNSELSDILLITNVYT